MPTAATVYCRQKRIVGVGRLSSSSSFASAMGGLAGLPLQSEWWKKGRKKDLTATLKDEMRQHLGMIGVDEDAVDKLKIIHVTGTKGKGSTCSMTDSLLSAHGLKTGLYTSPHLLSVTERIKLNGQSISEAKFARYFHEVKSGLEKNGEPLPPFFRFVTLMAFLAFVREKVDVAVVEVGIGGRTDATNFFDHPTVCGVTSIGYDHMEQLGYSLPEIAWEKSGIFKQGAPAYTTGDQQKCVFDVLAREAKRKKIPFLISPTLETYSTPRGVPIQLGLDGKFQRTNASLALALSGYWLSQHRAGTCLWKGPKKELTPLCLNTLKNCQWPGRAQTIQVPGHPNVIFHLDGAHTPESMQMCSEWFSETVSASQKHSPVPARVMLIFNCSVSRNPQTLLTPLIKNNTFTDVVFTSFTQQQPQQNSTPSLSHPSLTADSTNPSRRAEMAQMWSTLTTKSTPPATTAGNSTTTTLNICPTVNKALECVWGAERALPRGQTLHVLVTGSLWLVGAYLKLLGVSRV
ncbi:FolC protein [Pelomyxa schiedti]|nr:FolC protein [Pelomyxa schiedti]